jgi:mRNA interferase HicA
MKRPESERNLRIAGCYLKREGAAHSIWLNPNRGVTETVPRHNEIKANLARKFLKIMGAD